MLLFGSLHAQDQIEAPVAESRVQPQYPANLKSFLIEPARVEVVIDQQGVPFSLKSATSLPDTVVEALAKWRYRPARRNGVPVGYRLTILVPIHRPIEEMVSRMSRSWSFSRDMNAAFAAGRDLDSSKTARLEKDLTRNPADLNARLTLLAYSRMASDPVAAQIRLRQLLWFASNEPKHEVLAGPFASVDPREIADADQYQRIRQIWLKYLADDPKDPVLLNHATNFLRFSDPATVEAALQQEVNETDRAAVFLGDLYGLAALGTTSVDPVTGRPTTAGDQLPDTPLAVKARSVLTTTEDLRILFSGLAVIASAGPSLAKAGQVPAGYIGFCGQLLTRARQHYADVSSKCDAAPPPPPPNPSRLRVGSTVQQAKLLKQSIPRYPQDARSRGITGTVAFRAIIGKDGLIQGLELLEGPLPLYKSARDAVLRWEYKPTLLNGNPVGIETQIDVNYTLN
jgi:TonB family protein